ncbi:MAG TPA: glycosyltransferase [Paracoccaceae bacterium]|nr:glycosyltransferase [Paracoccaceae bacterium]
MLAATRLEHLARRIGRRLPLRPGLKVNGHLTSEIGLGEAARNMARAGQAAGLPLSYRNLRLADRDNEPEFAALRWRRVPRKAALTVLGLMSFPDFVRAMDDRPFNLAYPAWELSRLPEAPRRALERFDEVWAMSRFVLDALEREVSAPARWMPQALPLPPRMPAPRRGRESLRLLTFFDVDSSVVRKNPQAAVEAFAAAFTPERRDVELVVKLRGGARDEAVRAWLRQAATRDPRITVVDETLSRAALDALMADCDVFLSLHRSEGFGFGAAEALAAGKAVVSTDYGGTADFVTPETGYPVAWSPRPLAPGDYAHTEGQSWADPSVEAAAEALKAIYDSPDEARRRCEAGFALLRREHSFEAVGARMTARLSELGALRRPAADPEDAGPGDPREASRR